MVLHVRPRDSLVRGSGRHAATSEGWDSEEGVMGAHESGSDDGGDDLDELEVSSHLSLVLFRFVSCCFQFYLDHALMGGLPVRAMHGL